MAAGLAWKMNDTAHHRCGCHRECDRKPDLSRLPRLRLRPSPSLTVLVFQTMSFQKEEPPWVQNYTLAACLMRRPKLSSPPCLPHTVPLHRRVSSQISLPDSHAASASSRCPRRKRRRQPLPL